VPEAVAQRVEPAVVVASAQLVVGVEVGDVGDLGVLEPLDDAVVARRLVAPNRRPSASMPSSSSFWPWSTSTA